MPFPMVCVMSHNSSRLESYGHVKLENPHESSRIPKKSKCLQINYLNNKFNDELLKIRKVEYYMKL
jgi:hypothetical protein